MNADASRRTRENGHGSRASFTRSLDDLASLSGRELRQIFSEGSVPDALSALDGDLEGRMLAPARLRRGRVFDALATFAKSRRFPWLGKTFRSRDAERGEGENRVRLVRTRSVIPFATRFGISAVDGKPCIVLDYEVPIHDELREIAPGLFLGPACLRRIRGKPVVLVWFALQRS